MNKIISCFLIFVLLFSCGAPEVEKPEGLLSKEKMAAILYDITVINATKGVQTKALEENNLLFENFIYEKHKIDSISFAKSNHYYAAYPEQYTTIYQIVEARLKKEQKAITEIIKEEDKKKDSIRKAKAQKAREKDSLRGKKRIREIEPTKKKIN